MKHLFLLLCSAFLFCNSSYANSLRFVSEEYCPYTCKNKNAPGISVELAKSVLTKMGYNFQHDLSPFVRGVKLAKSRHFDGMLSGIKLPLFENFVFPEEHLLTSSGCLVVRKSDPMVFKDIESIKDRKVGVVQGYGYGLISIELAKYIKNPKNKKLISTVTGVDPTLRLLHMLGKKRIDVVPIDPNIYHYYQKKNVLKSDYRIAGCFNPKVPVYATFNDSFKSKGKFIKQFSDTLKNFKQTPEYQKILSKYGLSDQYL